MNWKANVSVVAEALSLLETHYNEFYRALPFAERTRQPVPSDSRAWSQILVSILTSICGRGCKKGSDFVNGSDVKAANCWVAIDAPRFNGVIPAGRTSYTSRKEDNISSLEDVPNIFFVLWDTNELKQARCRIWCVRPHKDILFSEMCNKWYNQRKNSEIKSNNLQLHPPRFQDHNIFNNKCGNLIYPLFFQADRIGDKYIQICYDPFVIEHGNCSLLNKCSSPEIIS